jgi:hypothetical protein
MADATLHKGQGVTATVSVRKLYLTESRFSR